MNILFRVVFLFGLGLLVSFWGGKGFNRTLENGSPVLTQRNPNSYHSIKLLERFNLSRGGSQTCPHCTPNPSLRLHFTTPKEQCGPSSSYFQSHAEALRISLGSPNGEGAVDPECIAFIMSRFGPARGSSRMLSKCRFSASSPQRGASRACVTEDYVRVTAFAVNHMATCLGVNPQYLTPKIMQESGFHWNAIGPSGDAGIGQLTGPAIRDVNNHFQKYKNAVLRGAVSRPSCRAVLPFVSRMQPVSDQISHRCRFMGPPDSPMLNIFYMSVLIQRNIQTLTSILNRRGVLERVRQLSRGQVNPNKLLEILVMLSYNAGAGGASSLITAYLDYREQLLRSGGRPLVASDFNIDDQPFQRLSRNPLSFSDFVKLYQRAGIRGYLSHLVRNDRLLRIQFPNGRCTMEKFLRME